MRANSRLNEMRLLDALRDAAIADLVAGTGCLLPEIGELRVTHQESRERSENGGTVITAPTQALVFDPASDDADDASGLLARVADALAIRRAEVDTSWRTIVDDLHAGRSIEVDGFGRFSTVGDEVQFSAEPALRRAINARYNGLHDLEIMRGGIGVGPPLVEPKRDHTVDSGAYDLSAPVPREEAVRDMDLMLDPDFLDDAEVDFQPDTPGPGDSTPTEEVYDVAPDDWPADALTTAVAQHDPELAPEPIEDADLDDSDGDPPVDVDPIGAADELLDDEEQYVFEAEERGRDFAEPVLESSSDEEPDEEPDEESEPAIEALPVDRVAAADDGLQTTTPLTHAQRRALIALVSLSGISVLAILGWQIFSGPRADRGAPPSSPPNTPEQTEQTTEPETTAWSRGSFDLNAGGFTIIVSSKETEAEAVEVARAFAADGTPVDILDADVGAETRYRVGVGQYDTFEQASQALSQNTGQLPQGSWIGPIE